MNILTVAEREELGLPVDYEVEMRALDAKIAGHDRDLAAELSTVPCGCHACDGGVQQGHFACEQPPVWALELERAGKIARHCEDSGWVWEAL
jgi:hypothetical protein